MTILLWTFIAIQIAMGALDTLYHHELTERLAWRAEQAGELKLHAIRNLAYAAAFILLALWQPTGLIAGGLIALLVAEVFVTLRDFVEEDRTRKLPETERVLHTLMTANYGVVLALLLPVLWNWATQPTGLTAAWYGWWSVMLLAGALAVIVFAARDWHASWRTPRLHRRTARDIALPDRRKTWLITGGTGFIGRRLVAALQTQGHDIIVLTRNALTASLPAPVTLVTDLDQIAPETKIDVVVNLAGEPLAKGLWTKRKRAEFRRSRLQTTRDLGELFDRLNHRPQVLINGSAIGRYGVNPAGMMDEYGEIAPDGSFAQALCRDWEAEAEKLRHPNTRIVTLRIGMVLDREGGALAQILVPTELGGGATFGFGDIMMSWITRDDLVRLIQFAAIHPEVDGPLNGTAPQAVTNKRFTKAVAKALYRPTLLPIPKALIKCLGGLGREILLADQTALPRKAKSLGFEFLDGNIESAMMKHLRPVLRRRAKHQFDFEVARP